MMKIFCGMILLALCALSALALEVKGFTPDKEVVYKTIGKTELRLHVFLPEGHSPSDSRPAIVFFFGGGWTTGSPSQFHPHCEYLASRGIVAISADYRVKSRHGTTPRECVADGKSAVRWIRTHAREYGIDPTRIAAGGGSAGGHVAAATGTVKGFEDEDSDVSSRPDALVLFNPVIDNSVAGFGNARVRDYWQDISPAHNIDANTPPTVILLGTRDHFVPVETARRYKRQMEEAGRRCDLHLYEDQGHGFFNYYHREMCVTTAIEMDRFLTSLGYLHGEPTLKNKSILTEDRSEPIVNQTLKAAFREHFYIGAALSKRSVGESPDSHNQQSSGEMAKLVLSQFSSISPCNLLKWGPFNPKPDVFNHDPADRYVEFGRENGLYVVGHVLFWHSQTPTWVFLTEDGKDVTREELLTRMRARVRHVANRYGSLIHAWDVVNESVMDNGSLRNSRWTQIIGDDFIEQAFRIADEELPKDVELIYNDYSMTGARKRDAVVRMVKDLKKKGVRIDGIGMQGHWSITGPSTAAIEKAIIAYASTGVEVHITELDIDVLPRRADMHGADVALRLQNDPSMNPYKDGLPAKVQTQLAERYADLFRLFLKHDDKVKRVAFWGVTDGDSWLNNWPIKGRTSYPLLFDRNGQPKPAHDAVLKLAEE